MHVTINLLWLALATIFLPIIGRISDDSDVSAEGKVCAFIAGCSVIGGSLALLYLLIRGVGLL